LAETRIKTGLLLGEVSDKEDIQVTPEELNSQIAALKAQYTDDKMRLELDKPENQRDIYSRIVIDKTVKRLREIAETSKAKAK
jgi:FKBP-type peptidyl-prolyl cis-trans isomerase (trigger factor)